MHFNRLIAILLCLRVTHALPYGFSSSSKEIGSANYQLSVPFSDMDAWDTVASMAYLNKRGDDEDHREALEFVQGQSARQNKKSLADSLQTTSNAYSNAANAWSYIPEGSPHSAQAKEEIYKLQEKRQTYSDKREKVQKISHNHMYFDNHKSIAKRLVDSNTAANEAVESNNRAVEILKQYKSPKNKKGKEIPMTEEQKALTQGWEKRNMPQKFVESAGAGPSVAGSSVAGSSVAGSSVAGPAVAEKKPGLLRRILGKKDKGKDKSSS